MRKLYWIIGIIILIVIVLIGLRLFAGGEDSWIKDSKGIWIKHGNPSETPNYVTEQQDAIDCAIRLYNNEKAEGVAFSSQCLGTCGNYAVDIVHVPRNTDDNLAENRCADFREGKVSKFIELDDKGEIVRIV